MSTTTTPIDQLLLDVFTTALEGGINYWAEVVTYHWTTKPGMGELDHQDVFGFYSDVAVPDVGIDDFLSQVLVTAHDPDTCRVRIDRSVVERGLGLLTHGPVPGLHETHRLALKGEVADPEEADIDAEGADWIVQAGLFGRIIFG